MRFLLAVCVFTVLLGILSANEMHENMEMDMNGEFMEDSQHFEHMEGMMEDPQHFEHEHTMDDGMMDEMDDGMMGEDPHHFEHEHMEEDPHEQMMQEQEAEREMQQPVKTQDPNQPVNCGKFFSCSECVQGTCAWCLSSRSCKEDKAWMCQGETDHVGLGGVGKHTQCPSEADIEAKVAERRRRKLEAKQRMKEEKEQAAEKSAKDKEKKESNNGTDAVAGDASSGSEPYDKIERWNELKRRSELAADGYGSKFPYETLEVDPRASSAEVRKAYRKLSVSFHPDKNIGSEEEREMADKSFKDIALAFEVRYRYLLDSLLSFILIPYSLSH